MLAGEELVLVFVLPYVELLLGLVDDVCADWSVDERLLLVFCVELCALVEALVSVDVEPDEATTVGELAVVVLMVVVSVVAELAAVVCV